MVSQNISHENRNFSIEIAFGRAIRELKISQLLWASNITQASEASAYDVFQFLLSAI